MCRKNQHQRKNMNSYNKQALDIIAKEQGFIRDNLEKVMRLVEILNYFHDSPLLSKSLVLKCGTAINLTVSNCQDSR